MATVSPSEKAADLLQNLSLDPQKKSSNIPEHAKKTSVYQYGIVDSDVLSNGQTQSSDRPATPFLPESMDPALFYLPGGYPSHAYYYGSYNGTEWDDCSRYMNADEVEMMPGLYRDNGSLMYHNGYGYASYGPYSPAATLPTLGNAGQLYGTQNYQYPPYFQPSPTSESFTPSQVKTAQPEFSTNTSTDQKSLLVESARVNSTATLSSGVVKEKNSSTPVKPFDPVKDTHGRVNDAKLCIDGKNRSTNSIPSRNFMSFSPSGMGSTYGFINRMSSDKFYSQYGYNFGSSVTFGSGGYDPRINGWFGFDNKLRNKGKGNGFFGYRNEKIDGLNELIKGPRAKVLKGQKDFAPVNSAVKGQNVQSDEVIIDEKEETPFVPSKGLCNESDFPEQYADAKFFIIKSYSEDDVHKSVKYNVWASTPNGNKKLNGAYEEAQNSGGSPVFLFFSVNTSGQFVGLAEMVGPVDFSKNLEYWQQDKWTGCFSVKWHIIKDIPNNLLKHIILENNENKPVTNSRDTQEVKLEQGLQMIKIFKEHSSKTCLLDDFEFYEKRQKIIQEKKAKQKQFQKQASKKKADDEKKEVANDSCIPPDVVSDVVMEPTSVVQYGDLGHFCKNGSVAKMVDGK